jgi:glycosyltransferase involved in cell wall biosynthesis
MINLFTPSFADEANTNAQNLSVKEIVARLDPTKVAVTMLHEGAVDPRIAARPNTHLLRWHKHGNTARILARILSDVPDVYFFPREGPLDAAFLTLRRYLRLKTALVSYVVSGGLDSQPYLPARERHIREADAVFANNIYLADLLKQKMGIEAAGIVYDGVDRRYFFPPAVDRERRGSIAVLYAGSLRPLKRVPLVVRQAARWPDVRFRIAGVGEELETCSTLAAQLGCNNLEFLGHLSASQLGEQMRRADIFFFPSILEGHPQVLAQAAASGLPCVAMNIYRPDFVLDGSTGFLAANDDELAQKLDQLISDRELRLAMGKRAIAHLEKFDWDVISGIWQNAFERVVARRRSH